MKTIRRIIRIIVMSYDWYVSTEYLFICTAWIPVIICIMLCMSCKTIGVAYNGITLDDVGSLTKTRFEQCIEFHPSDAVCDSCWHAIVLKEIK